MNDMSVAQRDKLLSDIRAVVADAEQLLKMGASDATESTRELRERMGERLTRAKDRLLEVQEVAADKAKAVGHAADDFVHENPWRSIAIGTGLGLLIGVLISRR